MILTMLKTSVLAIYCSLTYFNKKKIEKKLGHNTDLVEMMASRSKMIDNIIQSHNDKDDNLHFIYDDPAFREQLEKNVEKLERLLTYNTNLEDAFIRLNKKVKGIEELDHLKTQFENVYDVVF